MGERIRVSVIATAVLTLGIVSSAASRIDYFPHQESKDPDQKIGMINYGFRGAEIIRETGDIAQGFTPLNGEYYTDLDKALVYDKARQWEYAHLDWIAVSWDSGFRDEYFDYLLGLMKEPDFPAPNLKLTFIDEKPAFNIQSQDQIAADFNRFEMDFSDPKFLKDKNGMPTFFMFVHPLQGIDDGSLVTKVANEAQKRNLNVLMQEYPFYEFNPDKDKVNWFQYYDAYKFPTGTLVTKDSFTITNGYHKEGDLKALNKDYTRIRQDLREGLASNLEWVIDVTDGEGAEYSDADQAIFDIFNQEVPSKNI